jgi:phosphatidylethanolamine/phosphatidyl-N-methylethanolamine N-methyltransferase
MMDKTIAFYNRIAPVYPVIDIFLKSHRNALIRKINEHPRGKLLEIGVGNGGHLPLYNKPEITGIDISGEMIKRAGKYKNDSIQLLEMNGESMDFGDGVFDYAALSHVIAVVKQPDLMLTEVFRVLKPGGKLFILNHFTPDNALKYADRIFDPFSKALHFKSLFFQDDLNALQRFSLVEQTSVGKLSYFKIIILQKP